MTATTNAPMKKYVTNFTIHLGTATVSGSLFPIRAKSTAARPKLVSPHGNPVSQRYLDVVTEEIFQPAECVRGVEKDDGSIALIETEDLALAKASQLPKDIMNVTVHDASEVESFLFPSDNNAYILYPTTADPINKNWGDFIVSAVAGSEGKLAFLATVNLRGHEGLFRLTTWRGHLVIQKQLYPADLNPHDQYAPELTKKMQSKAVQVAQAMVKPFDPATYRDSVAERVNELAEASEAGVARPKKTAKPAQPDFDLGSAMDDMLASMGIDND